MYSLKQFTGALTLATAKPTRRYFSVTAEQGRELMEFLNQVMQNAAGIGGACGSVSAAQSNLVLEAAQRLAEVEQPAGFDRESAYRQIAAFITEHSEAPTVEVIRASLGISEKSGSAAA